MTTATRKNKAKILSRKVLSNKPAAVRTVSKETAEQKDEVGLSVLLNSNLPRSFKNRAEMDAHIRWLREE
jgi:hypothetical protein